MATVVNERDVLMQAAPDRVVEVTLPGNVILPELRSLTLRAPSMIFRGLSGGSSVPSAITATAALKGLPSDSVVTWSVTSGTATLTGTGLARTLAFADMTSDYVTIRAEVNSGGLIYRDELSFVKVFDGSDGDDGSSENRGTLSVSRAITGSVWSNAEANAAIAAAGGGTPISTDTCTLFNASVNYAEMRRFNGTAWEPVPASVPGSIIMPRSIVTEQLLVTGLGIALNSDPNTVDITAWTGNGISIVADTTAPNGASALRCAGTGTAVFSKRFPIQPGQNYRAKTWVKQETGSSTAFLAVAFYDGSGTLLSAPDHAADWESATTYHYFGLINENPTSDWVEHDVSFGVDEARKVPATARFAAVGLISNFWGTGVQRLSGYICHQKTDGSLLVDGSVTARHIDGRGLIIRNAAGEAVISGGDAVNPSAILGPVNLAVPSAIYVGDETQGLLLGSSGLLGRKNGVGTFGIDADGTAWLAGELRAASGFFAGEISAQSLDIRKLGGVTQRFVVPGWHTFVLEGDYATLRILLQGGGGGGGGGVVSPTNGRDTVYHHFGGGGGAGGSYLIELQEVPAGTVINAYVGLGGGFAGAGDWFNGDNGLPGGASIVNVLGYSFQAAGGGGGGRRDYNGYHLGPGGAGGAGGGLGAAGAAGQPGGVYLTKVWGQPLAYAQPKPGLGGGPRGAPGSGGSGGYSRYIPYAAFPEAELAQPGAHGLVLLEAYDEGSVVLRDQWVNLMTSLNTRLPQYSWPS